MSSRPLAYERAHSSVHGRRLAPVVEAGVVVVVVVGRPDSFSSVAPGTLVV
jgi:hypothetical protein